jgi:hypothetical protein
METQPVIRRAQNSQTNINSNINVNTNINLSNPELYTFECLKCGTNTSGSFYEVKESKLVGEEFHRKRVKRTYKHFEFKIPVCFKCKTQFTNWKESWKRTVDSCLLCLGLIVSIFIPLGILLLIAGGPMGLPFFLIPTIPAILFISISKAISTNHKRKPNNPHHFIKVTKSSVSVRPLGKGGWIPYNTWLQNTVKLNPQKLTEEQSRLEQRNQELQYDGTHIYCPRCGEKFLEGTKFCLNCGKDLRTP